jgi:SET domain-containing protein
MLYYTTVLQCSLSLLLYIYDDNIMLVFVGFPATEILEKYKTTLLTLVENHWVRYCSHKMLILHSLTSFCRQ